MIGNDVVVEREREKEREQGVEFQRGVFMGFKVLRNQG